MVAGFFANKYSQFSPFAQKKKLVGWNTGNMLFRDAIHKMIACNVIESHERIDSSKYDAFITTDLIWLQENVAPWEGLFAQLRIAGDKPLIPLSIGLQANARRADFVMHPEMVKYMKTLQERARLAVRGTYTADILNRFGITNVEVFGCPSVYQFPLYHNSLSFLLAPAPSEIRGTANFRTFRGALTDLEKSYLEYVTKNFRGFAEQTFDPLRDVEGVWDGLIDWMQLNSYAFFDLDTWRRYNMRYNFSMGCRFHGNVAAMLAGMRALFLVVDSRTYEMTEFLKLPAQPFTSFDAGKSLNDYYELADYGDFVRAYPERLKHFTEFASKCGLQFSAPYQKALADFAKASAATA